MAKHLLGVACLRDGRAAEGVEHERAALRIDRRLVAAMHNLAMAALHQEQWTRARYWVRQALKVAPDDASLRRLLLRLRLHRLVEVFAWAGFLHWKRALPSISSAYYLSLLDYTTLGCEYDLPVSWRLLEGMIAISGLMTFAWSTGVLFALAQEFQTRVLHRKDRPAPSGA